MIDLQAKTCPNREERVRAIDTFYGKASDLVKDARSGKIHCGDRDFQQASGCVLNLFLTMRVVTIRDAVMIVHTPIGCSSPALMYREIYRMVHPTEGRPATFDLHWLTTGLNEKDVVF